MTPVPSSIDTPMFSREQRGDERRHDVGVHRPLVSVIIVNYNYAQFVKQAIRSVSGQSYERIECLIVDNASTDGSIEAINYCLDQLNDDRFRVLSLDENVGQFGGIAAGLDQTKGPFVLSLDADDLLHPDFVGRHVDAHLNSVWSAPVTASDSYQIDSSGQILEGTQTHAKKPRFALEGAVNVNGIPLLRVPSTRYGHWGDSSKSTCFSLYWISPDHLGYHVGTMSCLMFRRSFLELVRPKTDEKICADYYYYMMAHGLSGTLVIAEPLTYYRIHSSNNFATGHVLGGKTEAPKKVLQICERLHELMVQKLLTDEENFSAYPRQRYFNLIKSLIPRRNIWRSGRASRTIRKCYGHHNLTTFALRYHPVLKPTPLSWAMRLVDKHRRQRRNR